MSTMQTFAKVKTAGSSEPDKPPTLQRRFRVGSVVGSREHELLTPTRKSVASVSHSSAMRYENSAV